MSLAMDGRAIGTAIETHRPNALALAVTAALHVAVAAGLMAGVHVARLKAPPSLMVEITAPRPKKQDSAAPMPTLAKATVIMVPPPEVTLQPAPNAVPVAPPVLLPVAQPQTAPAQQDPAGESRVGESRQAFLARLLAQLNRFKHYPPAAARAHIQGVVMLHFVMAADGQVIFAEIAKSSGKPVLDAEALALIRRAAPLPALPPDSPTTTLDAVVPVEFSLAG